MTSNIKIYKFIFSAEIRKLLIKTAISCPISATWKRSAEVAKTDQVTFANGTAEFNQTISLSVNMYYDQSLKNFQQKKSQFSFTLHTPKGEKSAGIVIIDLAIMLNNHIQVYQQDFKVDKCPDKQAKVHIKIQYQMLGQQNNDPNVSHLNNSQIMAESSMISGVQENNNNNNESVLGNLHSESNQIKEWKQKFAKLSKQNQLLKVELNNLKKNAGLPISGDQQLKKQNDKLNKQVGTLKTEMLKSKGIQEKLQRQINQMRNQSHEHDKQLQMTRMKLQAAYQKLNRALSNLI